MAKPIKPFYPCNKFNILASYAMYNVQDYLHKAQVKEIVYVYCFLLYIFCFVYVAVCFPPALHNLYFICLWHDIAYLC